MLRAKHRYIVKVGNRSVQVLVISLGKDTVDLVFEEGFRAILPIKDIKVVKELEKARASKEGQRKEHVQVTGKAEEEIVLLSTGGTIAGRPDPATGGLVAGRGASELYSLVPELADIARIRRRDLFTVLSEDMSPSHWLEIADAVFEEMSKGVRGIIVSHGTDTMHYTAAALSFMLKDLPVPVVMVGSQKSIDRPSSDGALNLIHAAMVAAYSGIAEVVVTMFGPVSDEYGIIHRGTRVRKMHTSARSTFRTIGDVPLGIVDEDGIHMLREDFKRRDPNRTPRLLKGFCDDVTLLFYYPGMQGRLIDWLVDSGIKGIVLAGTGMGHVGSQLLPSIERATRKNVKVFMTSQTLWGFTNLYAYQSGRRLLDIGVIPLKNMLPETAFVKLGWALAVYPEDVEEVMVTSVAGEVTPGEPPDGFLIYQAGLPEIVSFLKRERL